MKSEHTMSIRSYHDKCISSRRNRYLLGLVVLAVAFISDCTLADPTPTTTPQDIAYDWPISTPSEQGLQTDVLENAYVEASRTTFTYSLLIVRNGYLVSEAYFNGVHRNQLTSTFSATKSVTSALVGMALEEGHIDSLDQRMLDFFPEYDNQDDERKGNITIRHLLTMQAGFDEETNISTTIDTAPNTVAAIIQSDLRFDPGSDFLYSTHGSHLLSAIVARATGMDTEDYAATKLFQPLGVDSLAWAPDYNGVAYGGSGLYLTPRDMARFGYLYLQGGSMGREQIFPNEWVTASTRNHRSYTTPWAEMSNVGYGYLWWTGEVRGQLLFFASGFGGQWIVVVPTLDMVVVSTANAYTETQDWQQMEFVIELLDRFILPAAMS